MRAWTVTHEARGTRYRLVLWSDGPGVLGVAWPDARWSVGDLSSHASPAAGWLAEQGLQAGDASEVAAVLAREWRRLAPSTTEPAPATDDDARGMAWWNGLSRAQRREYMARVEAEEGPAAVTAQRCWERFGRA